MLICFVGIDGSGKTVQAERLVQSLKARGIPCAYTWCRYSPRLMLPFIWGGKLFIRRKKGTSEYGGFTSAKRGLFRKPIVGWLWYTACLIEYLAQISWKLRFGLRGGRTLVCDRYIYDLIADKAISLDCIGDGAAVLACHPLIRLFPAPDKVFFLDIPPALASERKNDPSVMGEQYLADRVKTYSYLTDALGFTRIDGTKGIDEIADLVLRETIKSIESLSLEDEK